MSEEKIQKSFFGGLKDIVTGGVSLISQRIDESLTKSYGSAPMPQEAIRMAIDHDPQMDLAGGSFLERQSQITFDQLRKMSERDVIVAAIVTRRCNQVAMFSRPSSNKYSLGFKVSTKLESQAGDKKIEEIKRYLMQFILNTGRITEERPPDMRNSFDRFLRLIAHDILVFDCVAIEKIHDNEGRLFCFNPVAADSIRYCFQEDANRLFEDINPLTDTEEENQRVSQMMEKYKDVDPVDVKYKQVHMGRVAAIFTEDDLFYTSFTPSNNLNTPYSVPPLEKAVNIVSSHLFAESTNRNFFTQGGSSKGILVLKGDIPTHQLEAFRRNWYHMASTTKNAWRTPIISLGSDIAGLDFVQTASDNKDMEWSNWMNYLVKCLCAIYLIDPSEIGWMSDRSGGLGDSGNKIEQQAEISKDNGLRPLLRFIEDMVNEQFLKEISPEAYDLFKFEFVGVNQDEEVVEIQKNTQKLQWQSVNEIRALDDLPRIEHPSMDIPCNSTALSVMQAMMAPQSSPDQQANEDDKKEENTEKAIKIEYFNLRK